MGMSQNPFYQKLQKNWSNGKLMCVGLDVDLAKFPKHLDAVTQIDMRILEFNRHIVEATHEYACAYKLNSAHYERIGLDGYSALKSTIEYIRAAHPDVLVILDAKRGDIGDTNEYYAEAVFDELGADVVTVHPYMGHESLEPFLRRADKGVIVMGANSAHGAGEIQDLIVGKASEPLYQYICRLVAEQWSSFGNCSVTAGADNPEKLREIRAVVGGMPILLLGLGTQGGDLEECIKAGAGKDTFGLIVNSSRAILYASDGMDYGDAAHVVARTMNEALKKAYEQR